VVQPVSHRPCFSRLQFQISTLEEVIHDVLLTKKQLSHIGARHSGLLIELKEEIATELTERDRLLCHKIGEILKKYNLNTVVGSQTQRLPIIIQSFNIPLLGCLSGCENALVQLYDKSVEITEEMLNRNRSSNTIGIGVTQQNLLNREGHPETRVGGICQKLGYSLCYWTIKDDDTLNIPFNCRTYHEVYLKLLEIGVMGFITEFPDKCKGALKL
jgi:glycerophosphoryl diester phosphodiesterase